MFCLKSMLLAGMARQRSRNPLQKRRRQRRKFVHRFLRNDMKSDIHTPGILHRGDCGSTRSEEVNSRVLPAQVGFPLHRPIGVIKRCLLYSLRFFFDFRAQKRVAQQRIDSRIPLGKLIDLRKKIYANVKVRVLSSFLFGIPTDGVTRASRTWVHKLVTNDP